MFVKVLLCAWRQRVPAICLSPPTPPQAPPQTPGAPLSAVGTRQLRASLSVLPSLHSQLSRNPRHPLASFTFVCFVLFIIICVPPWHCVIHLTVCTASAPSLGRCGLCCSPVYPGAWYVGGAQ